MILEQRIRRCELAVYRRRRTFGLFDDLDMPTMSDLNIIRTEAQALVLDITELMTLKKIKEDEERQKSQGT